jgi:putative transposase
VLLENRRSIVENEDISKKSKTAIPSELLDQFLALGGGSQSLTGPDGLLKQLTAALVSRALDGELDHHLGYAKGEEPPAEQKNRRNGKSQKCDEPSTRRTPLRP